MKWKFVGDPVVPTPKISTFHLTAYERFGKTFEAARALVPEGITIWYWIAMPEEACTLCGGPFHPATGHWINVTRHWCGPCTKDMTVAMIHLTAHRTLTTNLRGPDRKPTGKKLRVEFYAHAYPPPAVDTSQADLDGDQS